MKAAELYRELSAERHWAQETPRVRWCAARFYSGVETLTELRQHQEARPVARGASLGPLLTAAQVRMIEAAR